MITTRLCKYKKCTTDAVVITTVAYKTVFLSFIFIFNIYSFNFAR